MPTVFQFTKVLMPLISVAALAGCATHGPDARQSLLHVKERLVKANNDSDLRREAALIYEADLYWNRAWAARFDAAEANHLLFMAQGKLAMAQSVAALRKTEKKLERLVRAEHIERDLRNTRPSANNNSIKSNIIAKESDFQPTMPTVKVNLTRVRSNNTDTTKLDSEANQANPTSSSSASSTEKMQERRVAVHATNLRGGAAENFGMGNLHSVPVNETATGSGTQAVDRNTDVSRQLKLDAPQAMHTAEPIFDDVKQRQPQEDSNSSDSPNGRAEHQTASLSVDDRRSPNEVPEEIIVSKKPTTPSDEKVDTATPVDARGGETLNAFRANISAYCRSITAMLSDRKIVEQKCTELEILAKNRLERIQSNTALSKLQSHATIFKYCADVSRVLGAGYQIMEFCVDQELGSNPDNRHFRQGYVMDEPKSKKKDAAKSAGSETGN